MAQARKKARKSFTHRDPSLLCSIHDQHDLADYTSLAKQLMCLSRFSKRKSPCDYRLDFLVLKKGKQSDQILPKLPRLHPFERLDAIRDHPLPPRGSCPDPTSKKENAMSKGCHPFKKAPVE